MPSRYPDRKADGARQSRALPAVLGELPRPGAAVTRGGLAVGPPGSEPVRMGAVPLAKGVRMPQAPDPVRPDPARAESARAGTDDSDVGWGDERRPPGAGSDDWYRDERPPHHGG